MLTARQYADKYPGQVVKLSSKYAKAHGLNADTPIGTIVGFKPGQKGVIGSSKVAIWPGNYQKQYGLELVTKKSYHGVISNYPDHRLGIYLLSVDCIELATKPKPVSAYPHTCGVCGSPARKGANIVVCSKVGCKANRIALASVGPIPKFYTLDKDGFVLCPHCQIKDNVKSNDHDFAPNTSYNNNYKNLLCRKAGHGFTHNWKEGQKLVHQGRKFIWKNGNLTEWREPKKVVSKKKAI